MKQRPRLPRIHALLLLAFVPFAMAQTAPSSSRVIYVANVENLTQSSIHYTGRPWKTIQEGYLEGAGDRAQLWGLPAPDKGDFRIDAELKLPRLGKRSALVLSPSSEIVLTSGGSTLALRGRFFQTADQPIEAPIGVVPPNQTFRLTLQRIGGEVIVTHAGKEVHRGPCSTAALDHIGFDPKEGAIHLYTFTAAGSLPAQAIARKAFSNPFGMQLRKAPKTAAEVTAPVLVGEPPSQECAAITRKDGALEVYFITKPASDSISLIRSTDGGLTWSTPKEAFRLPGTAHYGIQALEDPSGAVNIVFHLFGQGPGGYNGRLYEVHYTRTDPNGAWTKPLRIIPGYVGSIRGFIRLKSGRLITAVGVSVPERGAAPKSGPDFGWNDTVIYYSDDGLSWNQSPDILKIELLTQNVTRYGAIEPTLVELNDGRLWMLIRDRGGRLYESFSTDHGARWSPAARTQFISSDSPAALLRLRDNRILLIWNPCQFWTDPRSYAMGGREVLHAAISADDGKTWSGHREILHETNQVSGGDRGTAYPSPTETADGKILVTSGQGEGKRALLLFDPGWLTETKQTDDLTTGPVLWTQYGDEGLSVEHDPKTQNQHLVIPMKSSGLCGASWNFPACTRGTLTLRLWIPSEASEVSLGFNDHFNRIDDLKGAEFQFARLDLKDLPRDTWNDLHIDLKLHHPDKKVTLTPNGGPILRPKSYRPVMGPCNYLRLQARSAKNSGALKISQLKFTSSPE